MVNKADLVRISKYVWEIPTSYRRDMKVPARIYTSEKLLKMAFRDRTMEQLVNTAAMPGVVKHVLVMHDAADGRSVALVRVGHDEDTLDHAGHGRCIDQLLQRLVTESLVEQFFAGKDDARNAHVALRLDMPFEFRDSCQC